MFLKEEFGSHVDEQQDGVSPQVVPGDAQHAGSNGTGRGGGTAATGRLGDRDNHISAGNQECISIVWRESSRHVHSVACYVA